jgi:endonuclease YncB( thermonuclease family)
MDTVGVGSNEDKGFPIAVFLSLIPWLTFADFSGPVVGITDGETISVMHDGKAEKVRLNGIDCPEKAQAFGQRASSTRQNWHLTRRCW